MKDTAVITFGKFTIIHQGHILLLETIAKEADRRNADMRVYLSHSEKPLSYKQKIHWARKSAPKFAKSIIETQANNIFSILVDTYDAGYRNIVMVAGSDRIREFEKLLPKYNGKEARHGYYYFDNIEVIMAGNKRTEASSGIEGQSSTKLREAAVNNDFQTFAQGVSDHLSYNEKLDYFEIVKNAMGVTEEKAIRGFQTFLKEAKSGQSTFNGIMKRFLILTPKVLERAFGGLDEVQGWHSTDPSGLKKLIKIEGKRNSVSMTTTPNETVIEGLQTSGGVMVRLRGMQLYKSFIDVQSNVTKEGLRMIDKDALPDEISEIVNRIWLRVVDYGVSAIEKRLKLQSFQQETIDRLKYVIDQQPFAVETRQLLLAVFKPYQYEGEFLDYSDQQYKEIRKIMREMVKYYFDLLEDDIWELEEMFKEGVGEQIKGNWNELIITKPKIKQIVFITELLYENTGIEGQSTYLKDKYKGKYRVAIVEDTEAFIEQFVMNENTEQLTEKVTQKDLDQVEKYADKLFAKVGIDVEFTKHFHQRINDTRNKKPITTSELIRIFKQTYKKYGKIIPSLGPDAQAVLKDMQNDINVPFVLNVDKDGMLDLVSKTIMRKKDFKTSNPVFSFEDFEQNMYAIAENIIFHK